MSGDRSAASAAPASPLQGERAVSNTAEANRQRVAAETGTRPTPWHRRKAPRAPRNTPSEHAALAIAAAVASEQGVSLTEIRSPGRSADLLRARQQIAVEARRVAGASLPEIGRVINRDHTTVLHCLRRFAAREDTEG
jgi:chromosomal replication initiation ATPase DnaA